MWDRAAEMMYPAIVASIQKEVLAANEEKHKHRNLLEKLLSILKA